jgi:hypothetical protein
MLIERGGREHARTQNLGCPRAGGVVPSHSDILFHDLSVSPARFVSMIPMMAAAESTSLQKT